MLSLAETPPETNAPNLHCPTMGWMVGVVKTNTEKSTVKKLAASGIYYFLPYSKHKTPSRNTVSVPLFPGYIFLAENLGGRGPLRNKPGLFRARNALTETKNSLGTIEIVNQFRFRLELYLLTTKSDPISASGFKAGERVRVKTESGLVDGFIDNSNDGRVLVKMECLGHPVSVLVDPNDVLPTPRKGGATPT